MRERPPNARWFLPAVLLAQVAAFWPVWIWYGKRFVTGIDEPWGLLALAAAVAILVREARARRLRGVTDAAPPYRLWLVGATALVIAYALGRGFLPPVVRGAIAMTVVGMTLSRLCTGRTLCAPASALLILSLPLSSALNFYLGYPVRSASALLAAPLLNMSGFAVQRAGTTLHWGVKEVWIDAPCSGVKMLWAGLFLAAGLAGYHRLSFGGTILAGVAALIAVFLGNILRAVALFYLEVGAVRVPGVTHTGVGIVVFAMMALLIAAAVGRLRRKT